jgi:hypothetical protein
MVKMSEEIVKMLNDRTSWKVIATTSPEGVVHVIPAGSPMALNPETIAFAAVNMAHTSKNLENMKAKKELASVLVVNGMKAYQMKSDIKEFVTSGPVYEKINEGLKKAIGVGARGIWLLEPKEILDQSPGRRP